MTNEVAEKIVRGIEDKIECNTVDIDDWAEFWGFTREEYEEFLDVAIKALEQQAESEDCISRQAVIDAIFSEPLYESGMMKRDADAVVPAIYEKIKSLPSVTPKTGKWMVFCYQNFSCSNCGHVVADTDIEEYKYCPKCGARMEE